MGIMSDVLMIGENKKERARSMRLMKLGWISAITLGSLIALKPLAQAQEKIKALLTPEQRQKMESLPQRGQLRPAPGAPGAPGAPAPGAPAAPAAPPK